MIEITKITEEQDLAPLCPEWERLWRRDPTATPFQSPVWQIAWWRYFGTAEPLLLAARRRGELVGLLPLYLLRESGCRKLLPIGVGVSDYIAALLDPLAADTAEMLITAIGGTAGWDECWLPDLAADDALAKAAAAAGLAAHTIEAPPCPVLQLAEVASGLAEFSAGLRRRGVYPRAAPSADPGAPNNDDFFVSNEKFSCYYGPTGRRGAPPADRLRGAIPMEEDLRPILPRKMLRDLRQARTRAAAVGGVMIEWVGGERLDAAMDDLFRLHGQRWRTRGESGVCADTRVQAFHCYAARALFAAGMLRVYRLWIGNVVAAVYYGFAAKGIAYAYLGGFDPSLPRLSPGAQIMAHAIAAATAEGATHFEFLRGGESYKYGWGAVDRRKISWHLSRR